MNATELELCAHPFLKGMRPEHQALLLEHATQSTVRPGEIIFRQGSPANRFFLIEEGEISVEACSPGREPLTVQTLGSGAVLGWSWLFEPFIWQFQARATSPVRMLVLDAAHLLRLTNENHEFGYELMKRVVRVVICCLQSARQRLLEVAPPPPVGTTAPGGTATLTKGGVAAPARSIRPEPQSLPGKV